MTQLPLTPDQAHRLGTRARQLYMQLVGERPHELNLLAQAYELARRELAAGLPTLPPGTGVVP